MQNLTFSNLTGSNFLSFLKLNIYLKTHWCSFPNVMLAGDFRGGGISLRLIFSSLFNSLCFAWRCLVMLNKFKFRIFFKHLLSLSEWKCDASCSEGWKQGYCFIKLCWLWDGRVLWYRPQLSHYFPFVLQHLALLLLKTSYLTSEVQYRKDYVI